MRGITLPARVFVFAFVSTLSILASSPAQAAPVITFTATPTAIASGGSSTLDWSVVDAVSCTASSPQDASWSGAVSATGGSQVVSPGVDSTYTLTCTDNIDPDEVANVVVTVGPPVSASVSTDFSDIPLGGSVQVSWSSTNATSCTGSGFSTGGATNGSTSVTPGSTGTLDFDLDCTGAGGASGSDSTSVVVGPAITASVTTDFGAVPLGGSVLVSWSSTDAASCVGTNFATGGAPSGSTSITPVATGTIDFDLVCSGNGGASGSDSASVTVGPPIAASVSTDFSALPLGGSVLVSWSSSDATSCSGTNFATAGATNGSVSVTPGAAGAIDFALDCSGFGGATGSDSTTVTVGPPIAASVTVDVTMLPLGGSVLITWSSSDANTCTGTNFATGGATNGSVSVTPAGQGVVNYALDCAGDGGATGNDSIAVTVGPPIAASVSLDFSDVPLGGSVLVSWSASDATSCSGTNFSTGGAATGSTSITPGSQGSIDFILDCVGNGGATGSDTASLNVGPPISASLVSDFSAFPLGGSALLTWSSTDATSCTGTGFDTAGATSGSAIVTPGSEGSFPFSLVCDGAGGASGSANTSVTVGPPITASLSGDFSALPLGGSVVLSWSSSQANTCTGTGFATGGATLGSVSVTPASEGSAQFDLLCSGDGGASGTAGFTVSVGPAVVASLSVDFSAVPLGGSVLVSWTSSDANSCSGTGFATGGATTGSVSVTPGAEGTLPLALDCVGDGGAPGSDATSVLVGPPVGASVTADFSSLPLGGTVLVSWSSSDANSCVGTGFATGGATTGSVSVTPGTQGALDFDLLCSGDGGATGSDSTTVVVGPPITATVTPDFTNLPLGGSVLVSWSSTDATSCTGTNFATGGLTSGSVSVTPGASGSLDFDLDCVGNGGATGFDTASVLVGPPITATLVADFSTVPLGGSVLLTWTSTDATTCTGTGFATGGAANGSVSITPGAEGTPSFDLDCLGNGGATGSASTSITVGPPITVSISSDFSTVPLGGSVSIDWSSTSANSCVGTGFDAAGLTSGTAVATPGAEGSATFTAVCSGNGSASGQASVVVTVIPPVAVSLVADFTVFPLGGSALITWDSTSANSCVGTGFATGSLTNGSVIVTPGTQGAAQLDLQCDGNGGAGASTSITLTVGPPISVSLTTTPGFIAQGGTSTLAWTSTDATTCAGDIFSTGGATVGSTPVTPVVDTSYNVLCTGAGGATGSDSATVTVGPPVTTSLSADFETIALGGSSTLTWTSANADSCSASSDNDAGFSGALATSGGSQLVTPLVTSTYTITCVGPGNATDVSNLTVVVGPPVVVDLSADFLFIAEGGSSLLTWTSANALSCTGTNFSTGGNTNSSQSVAPTSQTTYEIACVGLGNAIETAQVTVDVGPPVVADLTSDLFFIALGGSVELSWAGTGSVTSCVGDGAFSTSGQLTGATTVSPLVTTLYTLTCTGPGNASDVSTVSVTVGPPPTANLVSNFSAIPLGGTVQLGWSSENAVACSSADFTTGGNVGGVTNVTPLSQGDTAFTVTCVAPGGATATDVVIVTVGPPVTADLSTTFTFIAAGGSADLTWSSTSANSCSGNIFSTSGATTGTLNVAPTVTSTYTLTCVGDGGADGTDTITVVVGPAVTASLTASPTFIALGGTSTLSWVGAGGAESCDDDLQFTTNGALVGSDPVNPTTTTTYTLTCFGAGNAVETAEVTVSVGPPVVVGITADLTEVAPGGTSTLTWVTTGPATTCTGDLFLTGGALNGSADVMPTGDTTYTITCLGPGGVVEEDTVTVNLGPPVTANLVSNLLSVPLGGSINLTWTSTNAFSCDSADFATGGLANGGPVADTPSETIVYTITCTGAGGGTGTANVAVTVGDAVAATLDASIDSIANGGTTTLTWSSGNANSCTGTGFSTGGATSGSVPVSPTVSTVYFVQCDGDGGTSANSSVSVNVDPALAASLSATPTAIALGGSTTLDWTSTSATNCTGNNFSTGNNPNGSIVVTPTVDTTYTLTCSRAGSVDVQSSQLVTVGPPVQTSLASEFTTIALGGASLLTWSSENATTCTASSGQDPAWNGPRAIGGGTESVSPPVTAVYDITCVGPGGGSDSASVIVTVGPAVTASISANPAAIALGGSSDLSWNSANATNCTGDLFSTGGAVSGTTSVSPGSVGVQTFTLTCTGLGNVQVIESVDVTVGPAVTATLTADPTFVAATGTTTLDWSSTNATQCDGDVFATGGATTGNLATVPSETTTYTLTCTGAGGATATSSVTVSVGPAVTASLSASIESIAAGGSSTLTWDSANATTCTATSAEDATWSGARAIGGGTQVVTPAATSTYQIDCVGPGGASASASVTVAVGPAVVAALTADFETIASGGSTTLSWLGTGGATACSGDIFATGGTTAGSLSVSPTVDTTYTLTCTGAGGASDVQTLTITVGPPVTASLSVDVDSIAQGGSSTLSWDPSPNATSCSGTSAEDPSWAGSKPTSGGSQVVTPSVTATYVLHCDGLGGATQTSSVTITVGPPVTATIDPAPLFINLGGSSEISWSSTNATSCAGDFFPTGGATSGSVSVSPTTTTDYTLTCTGPGNAVETDMSTVVVGPPVIATLGATPTFIAAGGSSTLSWNGENALTCNGDVFATGGSTSNTLVVTPTETTTYTVTCVGAGDATETASVTVTVGPSVVASLSVNPTQIAGGGTATLSWSGTGGATACSGDLFSTGGALSGTADVNPASDQTYTVTCTGPGGASEFASVTVLVDPPVTADLVASLISIAPGGSTDLTWSSNASATTCSGDLFATGGQPNGTVTVTPSATTTYTVTCTGAGGATDTSSVTVTVGDSVTVTLGADPEAIASGGSSDLTWSSVNATTCTGGGAGFDTSGNPNGSVTVNPTDTTVFTVTCEGAGGAQASASVTVTVGNAVSAILSASLTDIAQGGTTTLTWASGNADTCLASSPQDGDWQGAVDIAGGTLDVSPNVTATYTLTCVGAGGAQDEVDVVVTVGPPVDASLTADPEDIATGGTASLQWSGTGGATNCEGDLFSTGSTLFGSVDVSPTETTVYTLTCTGPGGATDTDSVTVDVGPPVQAQLNSNILAIALGGSATLGWNSDNANECTASSAEDPFWSGPRASTGGFQNVVPIVDTTYTLVCVGNGDASATASVTILVGPAVTASLVSDVTDIAQGGNATLTWAGGGGAISCSGTGFNTGGALTGSITVFPAFDTTYTVTCDGAGGADATASVTINVGGAVSTTIEGDPETIAQGGSSLLTWTANNAESCIATSTQDPVWNGPVSATGGSLVVTPSARSTYEINCTGAGGATDRDAFTVQVGPPVNAALSTDLTNVALGGSALLTWNTANATSCTATSAEDTGWNGARSIAGGTQLVTPSIDSTYTLRCDGPGGAFDEDSVSVTVGPAPTALLTATPAFINVGGSSTLEWTGGGGATNCAGDLFSTGGSTSGTQSVSPTQTTTYTLTCTGAGGASISTNTTVTVGPGVGATLTADPDFIARGGSTTLSWGSGSATSCTASSSPSSSWSGPRDIAGGIEVVAPTVNTTYTLTCFGAGGASATTDVEVTVGVPVTAVLDADLFTIPLGGSVTLDWTGGGTVTSCSGDANFSTGGATTGNTTVSPAATTTYTLTCVGPGAASAQDTVTINVGPPVTASLSASPDEIALGGQSQLSWSSSSATSCAGVNFDTGGAISGSITVAPTATTTYSITCQGAAGATSAQVNESILVGGPVTVTLTATPPAIALGGQSTLSWSSTNANTCTSSDFPTGDAVVGSFDVSPSVSTTYTVTCSGDGGAEETAQATLTVGGQLLVNLSASPLTIARFGRTTLTWDGGPVATSCVGIGAGFDTGGATAGSIDVSPTSSATYTVSCIGPGGVSDDASVSIDVIPALDVTFSTTNTTIALGGSATLSWSTISGSDCTASSAEDPTWAGTRNPVGGSQVVNPTADATYTLVCNASGGTSQTEEITISVGPPVSISLTADPLTIAPTGGSTLTWIGQNAISCTAVSTDPTWQGTRNSAGGSFTVRPTETTTYTLDCLGAGNAPASASVTVSVGAAVVVNLTLDLTFVNRGGSATLSWTTENADSCTATTGSDPTWAGPRDPIGGSQVVTPDTSNNYRLTCFGAGGAEVFDTAQLDVGGIVVANVFTNIDTIALGGEATIGWGSQRALNCVASSAEDAAWDGPREADGGSQLVTPTQTSTYVLDCFGAGNAPARDTVTVTVGPAVLVDFDADPVLIAPGGSATLSWTSQNATRCTGDLFPTGGELNGTRDVSPAATTEYNLTCIGLGDATVTVSATVFVGDPVVVGITADPTIVAAGGTSTIRWTSENASACTGTNFDSLGATSGSVEVTLGTTPVTYEIACAGPGGVIERASTTVDIAPPPTASLTGNSPIRIGGTSTLVWTSSAISCTGEGFSTGAGDPRNGTVQVTAVATTTYTVNCIDAFGQTVSASFDLIVLPGPEITFSSDVPFVQQGDPVLLSWSVTGASACIALGDWDTSPGGTGTPKDAAGGSEIVNPQVDALYVLRCFDAVGQSDTEPVNVTIAPQINIFIADPPTIGPGGEASLIWATNNTDSCVASGNWSGGGEVGIGPGVFVVNPTETTDYGITCTGPGGPPATETATVIVGSPVLVDLSASRERIGLGQSTILTWSTDLADSCTITSDDGAFFDDPLPTLDGSITVSPTVDTIYTVDCVGAGGAPGADLVTVTIADAIEIVLDSAEDVVAPGGSTILTWSITRDAQSGGFNCTREASPASAQWNGTDRVTDGNEIVSPLPGTPLPGEPEGTTYRLTCTDSFYPTGTTESVFVEIAPIPTVTLISDAGIDEIAAGGLAELTWTSTDASFCRSVGDWAGDSDALPLPTSGAISVEPLVTTAYELECFGLHPDPGADQVNVLVSSVRAVFDRVYDPVSDEFVPMSWGEAVAMRSDRLAMVGSYENGLRVVDTSDETAPTEIGFFDPGSCINDTPFGDETLDFVIEDVAIDPANEDIVFVSAGPCGVYTLEWSFPGGIPTPTLLSLIDTNGWAESVAIEGDMAYVADFNGGVLAFDITDRADPQPLDGAAYDDPDFGGALEIDIDPVRERAFVASDRGLRVIDISDPGDLRVIASVDTDTENGFVPQGIRVWNGLAFLSSWTGGILVLDVRGAPVLLPDRRIETDYAFYKMYIDEANRLLYIAEGLSGIQVVDVSGVDSNGRYVTLEQIDIGRFVWDIGLDDRGMFVSFGDLDTFGGGLQMIIDRPPVPVPAVRPGD